MLAVIEMIREENKMIREQTNKEIAKRMLDKKISIDLISEILDMSYEEINKLK